MTEATPKPSADVLLDRLRMMIQQMFEIKNHLDELTRDATTTATMRLALRNLSEKLERYAVAEGARK